MAPALWQWLVRNIFYKHAFPLTEFMLLLVVMSFPVKHWKKYRVGQRKLFLCLKSNLLFTGKFRMNLNMMIGKVFVSFLHFAAAYFF